ncbi:MAG: cytochrome C [Halothiobacillaceae bacterium]
MTKRVLMMGVAMAGMVAAGATHAEPVGEMLAQTCAGCHGTQGRVSNSAFMPLAGMSETSFVKAMQDFQSGARPNTLMGPIAKGFSEAEIKAMAGYFAKQPK